MKINKLILFILVLQGIVFSFEYEEGKRLLLQKLEKNHKATEDDYETPFLIVQSGSLIEQSVDKVADKLKAGFSAFQIPKLTQPSVILMPKESITGEQLAGIEKCTLEKCSVKLNDLNEKPNLIKANTADGKVKVYEELVYNRIKNFLEKGIFQGYEDREDNIPVLKDMLKQFSFIKREYASFYPFIQEEKWKNNTTGILYSRPIIIAPDDLQPIWRVGQLFEKKIGKSFLFWDIHIYSNHYFDSSLAFYEIIENSKDLSKSYFIITEVLEVDELKKSAFIRALFKGKMRDAVYRYQDDFISKLK